MGSMLPDHGTRPSFGAGVGGRLLRSDFVVDLIDKSTRLTVDFHHGEVDLSS